MEKVTAIRHVEDKPFSFMLLVLNCDRDVHGCERADEGQLLDLYDQVAIQIAVDEQRPRRTRRRKTQTQQAECECGADCAENPFCTAETVTVDPPKRRGRPRGSRNKPKPTPAEAEAKMDVETGKRVDADEAAI